MKRTGAGLLLAVLAAAQAGAAPPPEVAARIDPALASRAVAGDTSTIAVWVEFRDKGISDAAGLAAALARAERALTPRARARRLRARVAPLVDVHDLPVDGRGLAALEARGLRPIAVSRWLNRAAVRVRGDRLFELAGLPEVGAIVPVRRGRRMPEMPASAPGRGRSTGSRPDRVGALGVDPGFYGRTFDALDQIRLPDVHACGSDGAGVLVCLLDDGFTLHDRHEALRDARVAPGHTRDFVDGDTLVTDSTTAGSRHGTLVMGVIAGRRPGAYVGAAPGADFALARTEESGPETPQEMLFWGMGAEWADSLGADIISSSVGYFDFDGTASDYTYADMDGRTTDVTRAAQIAASKGILVVNSVGNTGQSPWRHLIAPSDANGDSVIAVGAVDAFGDTVGFSAAGPSADGRIKPDLVARGVSVPVVSAFVLDGYATNSGTSFSAPLVAGAAACLMQAHREWTPTQVIQALRASASRAGTPDNKLGYGIPNAFAALHQGAAAIPGRTFELALRGAHPLRTGAGPARFALGLSDPLSGPIEARLHVADAQGRSVRTLWRGTLCSGRTEEATWDGRGDDGRTVPPGVYWAVLEGGGHHRGVRVVTLR
jgi:hypothetical protein